jgi:hypothetical protein
LDIYKGEEIPPDPDAHFFNIDVNQEEYDVIMRMRTIKRKHCELEFAEIKIINEAEQLEQEDTLIANDSKDEPGKPIYDPLVHNDKPGTRVIVKFGNEKHELQKKVNVQLSNFVKLTNNNEVALTSEDMNFFSTIKKGTSVMMRGLQILEEEHATLVDIHEIIVHSNTKIELKVGWNVSEGGNKRDTQIVGLKDVQFLHELGREDVTKKKSLRKGKKQFFYKMNPLKPLRMQNRLRT